MIGKIFVYGSLMTGFFNYEKLLEGKVIKRELGYLHGTLYHLKDKGYPGMITEGNTKIFGEVLTVKDFQSTLRDMDLLEGFRGVFSNENEYNRRKLPIIVNDEKHMIDTYVYNPKAFNNQMDQRILIESGSWRAYMEGKVGKTS